MTPLRTACLAAAVCTAISVATVHSATCPAPKFDIRGEFYFFPLPSVDGWRIVTGDWNEDLKPDLAVAGNNGDLIVMLGQGSFQMCPQPPVAIGHGGEIAEADFDADGHRDLVVSGFHQTTLLRGDGAGAFAVEQSFEIDGGYDLAVGRLDADADPDLVIGGTDRVRLIRLNAFAFADSDTIAVRSEAFDLADFDSDDDLDLFAAGSGGSGPFFAGVWLNDGAGNLALSTSYSTEDVTPSSIAVGDLNGDEFLDIMGVSPSQTFSTFWLYGNGDGTFDATPAPHRVAEGSRLADPPVSPLHIPPAPHFILLADLNHDDVTERVTLSTERSIQVMNQRSAGDPRHAVVADFDADGLLDVAAISSEGVAVHPSQPNGTLRYTRAASFSQDPYFARLVDLDGNSMLDMLIETDPEIILFEGTGGGGFTRLPHSPPDAGVRLLADVEGDGDVDLFFGQGILRSNGNETFENAYTRRIPRRPQWRRKT